MLTPGRLYPGTAIRLTTTLRDQNGNLVDPDTVTFQTYSPCKTEGRYVYGTDAEVTRLSMGSYAVDIAPAESGRWRYRWITTGTGTTVALEGNFLIQESPWAENVLLPHDYC